MAADDWRLELNRPNIGAMLKSPQVSADLGRRAAAIAAAAGANGGTFGHEVRNGSARARAIVFTEDWEAKHAEAKDRALTRAVDAGR